VHRAGRTGGPTSSDGCRPASRHGRRGRALSSSHRCGTNSHALVPRSEHPSTRTTTAATRNAGNGKPMLRCQFAAAHRQHTKVAHGFFAGLEHRDALNPENCSRDRFFAFASSASWRHGDAIVRSLGPQRRYIGKIGTDRESATETRYLWRQTNKTKLADLLEAPAKAGSRRQQHLALQAYRCSLPPLHGPVAPHEQRHQPARSAAIALKPLRRRPATSGDFLPWRFSDACPRRVDGPVIRRQSISTRRDEDWRSHRTGISHDASTADTISSVGAACSTCIENLH
jgi:hypothetical protein